MLLQISGYYSYYQEKHRTNDIFALNDEKYASFLCIMLNLFFTAKLLKQKHVPNVASSKMFSCETVLRKILHKLFPICSTKMVNKGVVIVICLIM